MGSGAGRAYRTLQTIVKCSGFYSERNGQLLEGFEQ